MMRAVTAGGGQGVERMAAGRDENWMRQALALAARAEAEGEVPVGAQILAMRNAAQKVGDYRLGGATLYVTLEPCPMCAAAIAHARIARLVFGAWDPRQGAAGSAFNLVTAPELNHRVDSFGGVLSEECGAVLKRFFASRRPGTVPT